MKEWTDNRTVKMRSSIVERIDVMIDLSTDKIVETRGLIVNRIGNKRVMIVEMKKEAVNMIERAIKVIEGLVEMSKKIVKRTRE